MWHLCQYYSAKVVKCNNTMTTAIQRNTSLWKEQQFKQLNRIKLLPINNRLKAPVCRLTPNLSAPSAHVIVAKTTPFTACYERQLHNDRHWHQQGCHKRNRFCKPMIVSDCHASTLHVSHFRVKGYQIPTTVSHRNIKSNLSTTAFFTYFSLPLMLFLSTLTCYI